MAVKDIKKRKIISSIDQLDQKTTTSANKEMQKLLKDEKDARIKLLKDVSKVQKTETDKQLKNVDVKLKSIGKEAAKDFGAGVTQSVLGTFDWLSKKITSGVDSFLTSYSTYYSTIQTRMLGTGKQYEDMLTTIKNGVTGSRATNVIDVISKLNDLVTKGIAFNVEQRAFLSDISDKIATTFDATNGTLLQLIRLNRVDSTAAYLGMEAALTEYLNGMFADTGYLTSNINESVSSAIYEATSQLGAAEGSAFEYTVQKWLGSFYESGMNTNTINSIAQAIGYLGSGNVSALTGNSQMNNLISAGANAGGLNYGDLLTNGLNNNSVNRLLQGIYQQISTISGSGDQVARSQYANMFGLTISDLTAMMQLSSKDLSSIASNMYSYSNLIAKTEYELAQVGSRTSMQEAIDNTVSNIMAEIGEGIGTNAGSYLTYKLADLIEGAIHIPIPFTDGFDLGSTMKGAILGYNVLSSMGDILGVLSNKKALSLSSIAGSTTYGNGFVSGVASNTISRGTGVASYYGTSESTATAAGSVASMKESSTDVISSSEAEVDQYSIDDLYYKISEFMELFNKTLLGTDAVTVVVEKGANDL